MTRTHTFDDLPQVDEIELDLGYIYISRPAKFTGHPDTWHDDESEGEITLCAGWEDQVYAAYLEAARQCIKAIPGKVSDLEFIDMPRRWAEEERRAA